MALQTKEKPKQEIVVKSEKDWTTIVVVGLGAVGLVGGLFWWLNSKKQKNPEFDLGDPFANPKVVAVGSTATITCPITNISDVDQKVTVKIDIYQAGKLWTAGALIESKSVDLTILAKQTKNAVIQHTGTIGGPTNSDSIAMRAIGITTLVGTQVIGKPWEVDNLFGVQMSGESVTFQLLNPIIDPAVSAPGQQVKITLPVVNNGTRPQSVVIRAEVHEMGATNAAEPGATVGSPYTSEAHTIQPGDTWQPSFNWTAAGASKGKWLVVSLYLNNTLAPNTGPNNPNIFKQHFEVSSVVAFDILQPQISPGQIYEGTRVEIVCPVKSRSTAAQTLTATIEVHYGSVYSGSGNLIEAYDVPSFIIQPGETKNLVAQHTEVAPSDGRRDVIVRLFKNGVALDQHQFDDAYTVLTPVKPSFVFGQPQVSPSKIYEGTEVEVTCPITMNGGNEPLGVLVEIVVSYGSILPGAGSTINNYSEFLYLYPGQKITLSSLHTEAARGDGRRDITVSLYRDGIELDSHQFDDAYSVLSGGGTSGYTLNLDSDPFMGGTIATDPEIPSYSYGQVVVCTANPISWLGYSFDHWELDGEYLDYANPINLMMMNNHTLKAVFIR